MSFMQTVPRTGDNERFEGSLKKLDVAAVVTGGTATELAQKLQSQPGLDDNPFVASLRKQDALRTVDEVTPAATSEIMAELDALASRGDAGQISVGAEAALRSKIGKRMDEKFAPGEVAKVQALWDAEGQLGSVSRRIERRAEQKRAESAEADPEKKAHENAEGERLRQGDRNPEADREREALAIEREGRKSGAHASDAHIHEVEQELNPFDVRVAHEDRQFDQRYSLHVEETNSLKTFSRILDAIRETAEIAEHLQKTPDQLAAERADKQREISDLQRQHAEALALSTGALSAEEQERYRVDAIRLSNALTEARGDLAYT